MPRCSAAGLDFRIIPAGFNAPLEFLTGFTDFLTRSTVPIPVFEGGVKERRSGSTLSKPQPLVWGAEVLTTNN
jgi:hypothetical protein